jgi:hypothetical protein
MILVTNYAFLIRVIAIHLVLVGVPFMPAFQLLLLIVLELLYFATSSGYYLIKKHIKNIVLLIPKIWQSLFLLTIELVILITYLRLDDKKLNSFGRKT